MTAPPKEKAAQGQPGGKASSACTINKTHVGVPVKRPVTEREVADQVRRGFEKGISLIAIEYRLKKWRPENDELIERAARALWDFEERYGEPAIERRKRVFGAGFPDL